MLKAIGPYRIYPRGFLGATMGAPLEKIPKPFGERLDLHQFHTGPTGKNGSKAEVNVNVEMLYAKYIKEKNSSINHAFREQVLIVALSAFGTKNFTEWFEQQHMSPTTGDLQRQFLDDTIHFIKHGRREICLETWDSLLSSYEVDSNITPITSYAIDFFGLNSRHNEPRMVIDIIQSWCSQPNGMEDLLGTLHILFGNTVN